MIQSNSEVIHTIRVFFASSLMARDKNGCKKFYKNNSTRKGKCRTARQKEGDRKRRKGVKKPRVKNPLYGKGTATQYWCDPTRSITMLKNRKQTRCAYLTSRYGNKTNTIVRPNPAKLPQILRPQIKAPATKEPLTQLPKTNTIVRPNAAKLPQILRPHIKAPATKEPLTQLPKITLTPPIPLKVAASTPRPIPQRIQINRRSFSDVPTPYTMGLTNIPSKQDLMTPEEYKAYRKEWDDKLNQVVEEKPMFPPIRITSSLRNWKTKGNIKLGPKYGQEKEEEGEIWWDVSDAGHMSEETEKDRVYPWFNHNDISASTKEERARKNIAS